MKSRALALAAVAVLAVAPLGAQQATAPTVTGETGLFTILDGQTLPAGSWSFGLYYDNWDRLVAPVPGLALEPPLSDDWDYDWNRLSASVGYGVTDRFELSLMLPWEDLEASDANRIGVVNGKLFERRIEASGLGNIRLGGKYRVFGGPEAERSMAVNAFVELPTGDDDEGVATGDTGFGAGASWSFGPAWALSVGYRDPGDADRFDVAEEILGGVGYAARLNDRFDWITELAATLYTGGDSTPDDAFDLTTGGRYWFGEGGRWAFNFGLRLELNQLSDTDEHCPIGGLVGLAFFPRFKNLDQLAAEREAAAAAAEAEQRAAEVAAQQAAEEAARRAAEEEAARKAAEEAARRAAEEEAARRAAEAAPKPEVRETIHFDSGSSRLSNIAKAKLDEVALRLKQDPGATARILGYTDAQGSDAANRRLAQARAEAARKYLVDRHGIDAARIEVESHAEEDPVAGNETPAGRKENRRAVIVVQLG